MTHETQWMNNWITMTRTSIDTGARTLENISQQAERALELTINSANIVQGETRKMYDSWLDNVKSARKIYTEVVQDNLNSFDSQLKTTSTKK